MKNKKLKPVRTWAVVDGSNVMSKCKRYNPETKRTEIIRDWSADVKKLYQYLTKQKGAKKVFFFGPYYPGNPKSKYLNQKLKRIGYTVRLRKAIPYYSYERDYTGKMVKVKRSKANVDGMLPVDICLNVDKFDELLFCSGDGDFLYMMEILIKLKKIVRVYSFGDVTSGDIKRYFGGNFVDLRGLKQLIGYRV